MANNLLVTWMPARDLPGRRLLHHEARLHRHMAHADRMERNIARLRARLDMLGVALRPHLKTAKSVNVARRAMATPAWPATVSTLREAEKFGAAGVRHRGYHVVRVNSDKVEAEWPRFGGWQ
jgi:hypothetical protein